VIDTDIGDKLGNSVGEEIRLAGRLPNWSAVASQTNHISKLLAFLFDSALNLPIYYITAFPSDYYLVDGAIICEGVE
jgi:hypothetical protein